MCCLIPLFLNDILWMTWDFLNTRGAHNTDGKMFAKGCENENLAKFMLLVKSLRDQNRTCCTFQGGSVTCKLCDVIVVFWAPYSVLQLNKIWVMSKIPNLIPLQVQLEIQAFSSWKSCFSRSQSCSKSSFLSLKSLIFEIEKRNFKVEKLDFELEKLQFWAWTHPC